VLHIAFRLPWWASAVLALVIYLALDPWANAEIPKTSNIQDAAAAAVSQMYKTLAAIVQLLFPLLLLIGSAVSALRGLADANLFGLLVQQRRLHAFSWREFERVVGELFRRKGYSVEETAAGADGGVDLVVRRDGRRYLVQCKHWRAERVGVRPVRELFGVVAAEGAYGGFVVTSGGFTEEARRFADGQRIHLIDGYELKAIARLIDEGARPPLPLPPRRPNDSGATACPLCGAEMVRRTATRGPNRGHPFFGCSRYPTCKGIARLG
jgi:restriction system protein